MTFGTFENPSIPHDPFECALSLRDNILCLTTQGGSEAEYALARRKLMADKAVRKFVPDFVRYSSDAASVRSALSTVASGDGSWAKRRGHVYDAFRPLLTFLESREGAADSPITDGLGTYDAPAIQAFWAKALDRRTTDP